MARRFQRDQGHLGTKAMMNEIAATHRDRHSRLAFAQVLVELGDLLDAEREIAEVLDGDPKNLTAFNLLAKIKHMRGELSQAIACWAQIHAQAPHDDAAQMCLGAIVFLLGETALAGRREAVHSAGSQSVESPST